MKATRLLGATALISSFALLPSAAWAQNTGATATDAQQSAAQDQANAPRQAAAEPAPIGSTSAALGEDGPSGDGVATNGGATDVVVTGSRISRPNLQSTVPITSISGEQFFQNGQNNIGDELNDLPQLRSTFAQQNPGLGIGIAGLNLLDLRGLGTARTLVLVNGRRHVPADILNNASSPDINTIPNDLIERVDIVTGGNSAVYGSDAIAGVVNFVLKQNYDGLQLRAQTGVAEAGFGGNQYVSALAGKNFSEGRGNITLHGEYAHNERVFASNVPYFRRQDALAVVDVDTAGLPNGSDGFPDRILFRDLRSATNNRFGLVPISQPAASPLCGVGLAATNGAPGTTGGTPLNCTYIFSPGGQLTPQTGTRFGAGPLGTVIGGNGQTGREDQLLSVLPKQDRYNANLLAHYSFSDALEAFVEAKFSRIDTRGSNAGPSFIQGTLGQYDIRERVRIDNPFLSATDRTTIRNAILASGCNTSLTIGCTAARSAFGGQGIQGPLNTADLGAIAAGTYRFVLARNLVDSGIRDEQFRRDTYRVVGGLRGKFNDDWRYEISANYGEFKERTTTYGYVDRQRFLLSLDAGRNTTTGQIQCRSQFDAASATVFTPPGLNAADTAAAVARNQAKLASDIAACVPYNPVGATDNSAAARYFVYNATNRARLSQFDITGFVSGDLSQLFELPGGPIGFAIGGEYRREKARYDQDAIIQANLTNAVNIPTFSPPAFKVKEGFGELRVPLLKDVPFFQELTFSGAGRVSSYGGATGTVYSYNGGVDYAPIRDIRFRGNYSRAVRAPNVSETGFPRVPNFANNFQDPCLPLYIGNNPNRQANCAADLGGLLNDPGFRSISPNASLPVISGSNPNLQAEKSDSYTVGTVIQPSLFRNFSLSVDYYNIKVNNVIVSLAAQNIANLCYDQPSLQNQFCGLFTRYRGSAPGPLNEVAGQILGNSLVQAGVNFAKRIREGIDTQVSYKTSFAGDGGVSTSLIYTHNLKNSNYNNPALPNFENRILEELGDPKDEFRWDVDVSKGPLTAGYRMHYIGPMYVNEYEDFNALPAACTTAGCPPNNADYADIQKYQAVFYHDIRFEYNLKGAGLGKDFRFYFGVDNVLDTHPPLGSTATGAGSAIYDFRGRAYYAGFRSRF